MACQRRCRDVDVPYKAVVNCDALCSTFSDALRFVHLDMVNKLPQQRQKIREKLHAGPFYSPMSAISPHENTPQCGGALDSQRGKIA